MQEKTLDSDNFLQGRDSFSARLQAVMAELNLSQSDLARRCDTRQSTVQGWLSGSLPRARTLTQLANAINVSEVWLELGIGDRDSQSPARVNEPSTSYLDPPRSSKPENDDPYMGVISALIDIAPGEMLSEVLTKISSQIPTGSTKAIREAEFLIRLIKERRPTMFEPDNTP